MYRIVTRMRLRPLETTSEWLIIALGVVMTLALATASIATAGALAGNS